MAQWKSRCPCLHHSEHVVMRYCWVNCGHFNSHPSQAGDRLVPLTAIGAGGGLTAHVSRAKANSLVAAAGQQWPGLGRLAVRHMGCAFLLTAEPSFQLMQRLTSLRWGGAGGLWTAWGEAAPTRICSCFR